MYSQLKKYFHILMAATTVLTINGCIYEDMKPCFEDDVDITIVNDWALAPHAQSLTIVIDRKSVV